MNMFIVALVHKAKLWKSANVATIHEHMEYTQKIKTITQNIKKNEIMSFAGKWIELEIITLLEISQAQKDKYHVFSLTCGL
jgi:hypothetical protein